MGQGWALLLGGVGTCPLPCAPLFLDTTIPVATAADQLPAHAGAFTALAHTILAPGSHPLFLGLGLGFSFSRSRNLSLCPASVNGKTPDNKGVVSRLSATFHRCPPPSPQSWA